MELLFAFVDKYGVQTVLLVLGAYGLYRFVMFGMAVLNRMSEVNQNDHATQNRIDTGQLELSMQAMKMSEASQNRMASLQDTMFEEQRNNQRILHRLTDEITSAALEIAKAVKILQTLISRSENSEARTRDWDDRMALFMRKQDEQTQLMVTLMRTITGYFETLLSRFKDPTP